MYNNKRMNFNSNISSFSNLTSAPNATLNTSTSTNTNAVPASSKVTSTYKVQPVHIKYRMISLNFAEKDGTIVGDLTTGSYPIQTIYNPNNNRNHSLTIKVECHPNDRQKIYEIPTQLLFTINSDLNWIVALVENEHSITIEIHSGSYPMLIDQSNKLVLIHGNNLSTQNNHLQIKVVPPCCD